MKNFMQEFSKFIKRGNVLDLAVGVIIGGAFQAIVNSLITNILSPILGLVCKENFDALSLKLFQDETTGVYKLELKYGAFITSVLNFLIMAFVVFIIVRTFNRFAEITKKKEEKPKPTTKKCPYCLSDVPIKATRCPHCTSELEIPEEEEEAPVEKEDLTDKLKNIAGDITSKLKKKDK